MLARQRATLLDCWERPVETDRGNNPLWREGVADLQTCRRNWSPPRGWFNSSNLH